MIMKYMNPADMLDKSKKKGDILNTIIILVASSVIFAISAVINISSLSVFSSVVGFNTLSLAISVFGIIFVGGLFIGWLVTLAANTLGAKGGLFEGITSVTFPMLYLSFGFLLSSLLSLIPNPVATMLLSFASVMIFGVIAYATMFRAVKEFFGVDILTSFIIVTIIFGVSVFAVYAVALGGMASSSLMGQTGTILT